ncbi:efflux RND transporter periplasmic adaptor subunit [Telluria mixta]|uniref:Efflux RND transporter periplasmic adaptor subunit n=1 Tax=Telluria mixta TaxID=34071 RepID=A0ABT2C6Y8_9BURK|nr:efflux RND transporter periplasmic adaptor subunit [Telluria mixta]MCS0633173.1 efflux RND transporter periplasmic adaptor subunit [Telluria mixta]WEM94658.1 efflux RND transporter periplasmic adaptor subunit [Telluria mixta]
MQTKPHTPRNRSAIVAVVCVLGAGAIVTGGLMTRHSQAVALQSAAADNAVRSVNLVAWKDAPNAPLELPARIEAWSRAPIYARVGGYVGRWNVDIGAPVKSGQVLAVIETPDLDQDLRQAQAQLAVARTALGLAESTAQRWQSLVAQNAVSKQEADEKQNDFVAKQANVQALTANVERQQALKRYTRLVAPFDGVVTARNIDVGALVNSGASGTSGSELFVVSDLRKLRVYVQVPQRQVALIHPGSSAVLNVPERPGRAYKATVQSLAQAINAGTGAMLVQLAVDNAGGELLPGAYANVRFDLPAARDAVLVPPGALILGKNGTRVATVDAANRVHIKSVTIARDLGNAIQLEGVTRADRIIDSPPDGIGDGDQVRVAKAG